MEGVVFVSQRKVLGHAYFGCYVDGVNKFFLNEQY